MSSQELPAKAVMAEVSGRSSTGPKDVLFVKWKEQWNALMDSMDADDELNVFNWELNAGTETANVARRIKLWAQGAKQQGSFGKGDYDTSLKLICLFLGHYVPCKIPRPCNVRKHFTLIFSPSLGNEP